jgi:hypothetical protein
LNLPNKELIIVKILGISLNVVSGRTLLTFKHLLTSTMRHPKNFPKISHQKV